MTAAIKIEGLSKKYIIGHQREEKYTALRDVLMHNIRSAGERLRHPLSPNREVTSQEEFWALRDINLEIAQGERLGIIGRNGAGKSTLLKLLSRITTPTEGRFTLNGRVASLLEVGTGFHPELSGRENIYLNGAILGMSRVDIRRKFDEIVEFSEVEKFLDTPVKRFSSGMHVRLAFAVAANLESDILVVDEVLAVGDARFQKKCLGKMEEVGNDGRTVLFVSHNMATISSLCTKGVLLDSGRLVKQGPVSDVILDYYSKGNASPSSFDCSDSDQLPGDDYAQLLSGSVVNAEGKIRTELEITQAFEIRMTYRILRSENCMCSPNFHFHSSDGSCAFVSSPEKMVSHDSPGTYQAICKIPGNFLNEGTYFVGLAVTSYPGTKIHFFDQQALSFHIRDLIENVPTRGGTDYAGPIPGIVRPLLDWQIRSLR